GHDAAAPRRLFDRCRAQGRLRGAARRPAGTQPLCRARRPRRCGGTAGRGQLPAAPGAARPQPARGRTARGGKRPRAVGHRGRYRFPSLHLRGLGQSADRGDRPAALAASAPRHGGGPRRKRPARPRVGRARGHPARARGRLRARGRGTVPRPCRADGRHSHRTTESRDFPRGLSARRQARRNAMKLTSEQLKRFDEQGYLFFPNYFSAEETAILKASVPEVFAQRREENVREKTGDVVRTAFAVHTWHPVFEALIHHPRFFYPAKHLLKARTYIHQFKINGKAAFDGDVWQWHQDYGTWKADDDMPEARAMN